MNVSLTAFISVDRMCFHQRICTCLFVAFLLLYAACRGSIFHLSEAACKCHLQLVLKMFCQFDHKWMTLNTKVKKHLKCLDLDYFQLPSVVAEIAFDQIVFIM